MSEPHPLDRYEEALSTPKRRRRPWWKWNVVALAVGLFVFAWVRHLAEFDLSETWLGILSIFAVWGIGPALFLPTLWTTLPPEIDKTTKSGWWSRRRNLSILRGVAGVLTVLSLIHLGAYLFWFVWISTFSRYGWRGDFIGNGNIPLFEFLLSALLYTLTEIALRLDR